MAVRPYNETHFIPGDHDTSVELQALVRNFSSNRRTHNSEVHSTDDVGINPAYLDHHYKHDAIRRCLRYLIFRGDFL